MASVYIPGHGNVGSAPNVKQTIQGYDDGWYSQGSGAEWGGSGDSAYQLTPGLQFNYNQGGWYDGSDGAKYDLGGGFDGSGNYIQAPGGDSGDAYYRRRNDALNTYKNAMGRISEGWDYNGNGNNYSMDGQYNHRDWVDQMDGKIKTGEKQATRIQWKLDPNTNMWEPTITGREGWDTNESNRTRNMVFAAALTAGIGGALAPAAAGALGGAEGMSMAAAAGATEANLAGAIAAQAGGYGAAGGGAGFMSQLKDAYDLYQTGNKVYKGYNTLSNLFGGGGSSGGQVGGARSQQPGGAGGGGMAGEYDWLNQLFNMGGSMYSANKNDNYADEMRAERERSLAERQPFLDRVGQLSGDAGAEQFRNGGTWQAAERVAANNFTRRDASRGNLANDTDRTRLLQDHFVKNLEAERGAARADLNSFDEKASRDALMKAIEMDRMKNSPLFAGAAYGAGGGGAGGAGGLGGLGNMVGGAAGQIGNWYNQIRTAMPTSTWGSDIGAPGANPDYGMGSIPFEMDYPYQEIVSGNDFSWLDTADWI